MRRSSLYDQLNQMRVDKDYQAVTIAAKSRRIGYLEAQVELLTAKANPPITKFDLDLIINDLLCLKERLPS